MYNVSYDLRPPDYIQITTESAGVPAQLVQPLVPDTRATAWFSSFPHPQTRSALVPGVSRDPWVSSSVQATVKPVISPRSSSPASVPHYRRLLPPVCGLGPRKAFLNSAGFLRIVGDTSPTVKHSKNRQVEDAELSDPLDNTRIHPEDYELTRKMATDALELDEEDIHDEDNERKLDDFAVSLFETNQDKKRYTLFDIRGEILKPFGELRKPYRLPASWDVLTMLTGETPRTPRTGLIVSVLVIRTLKRGDKGGAVAVRLNSGIEGIVEKGYLTDTLDVEVEDLFPKGRMIPAVVFHVGMVPETDSFWVRSSARQSDVSQGDSQYRRVRPDEYWDHSQYKRDIDVQNRKKRGEANQTRRIIKHPNFHSFNSTQAEAYLDKQQRGGRRYPTLIQGSRSLAVAWKVDDKLYQHISTFANSISVSRR